MYKVSAMFSAALLALTSLCEPVVFAPKPYVDKQFAAATNFAANVADESKKDVVNEVKALGYATSEDAKKQAKSYADSATNAVISYVEGKGYVTSNDLSSVATSGDYNDLSNKPAIPDVPSDISGFTNDAGYVTESVTNGLVSKGDLSNATNELAKAIPVVPHVPTKVSELANDSGYISHEEDGTFLAWKANQILVAGESASAHSNPDYGSVALGKGANAKGSYSVAVGNNAKATKNYTTAVGNSTEATGFWSVAYGGSSEAIYQYATAIGYQAHGVGENAVAVGHSSRATMDSVAVGNAAQSSVKYGIAIGSGAQAAGDYGIAIGYKSYAMKSCFSIPFGPESFYLSSSATDGGQTAKNLKSYLDEKASVALLNSYSNELSTAISNSSPDDYENVSNRAANAASRVEMTSATNSLATSIEAKGYLSAETDPKFDTWTNASSVALGNKAKKGETNGTTVGGYATAGSLNSTAVGAFSKAGYCSSAFGYGATADGAYSLALGYDSYAPNSSSMGLTFTPEEIYLGAKKPSTAGRTLQSYFDEMATSDSLVDVSKKVDEVYNAGFVTESVTNGLASVELLNEHANNKVNPHGVSAAQIGALTNEATFIAYTNGASVSLCNGARAAGAESAAIGRNSVANGYYSIAAGNGAKSSGFRSSAFGTQAEANGGRSTALGYLAYAKFDDTVAIPFDASHFYLNSSTSDKGASGYSLQSMFDAVTSNIEFTVTHPLERKSNRYVLETLDGTDVVAQDAHIYSITAGTNGFTVVTPDVDATYSQDFVIRVHVADANGTQIARLEDYLYDFPSGDLTETASIAEDGYVTFMQVTKGRWLVCYIRARPQEQSL